MNSSTTTPAPPKQRAIAQLTASDKMFLYRLRNLLERVYTDGIDQFIDVDVDASGSVTGIFRDERKILEVLLELGEPNGRMVFKQVQSKKLDSWLDGFIQAVRTDKKRSYSRASGKGKKCGKGTRCGMTCIEASDTCRIALNKIASTAELQSLRSAAMSFRSGQTQAPGAPPEQAPPQTGTAAAGVVPEAEDPLDSMSIRELKKQARDRGIYRYSEMTKEQLKAAVKLADENPEQQERVEKTLTRNRSVPPRLRGLGITGKTAPEKALTSTVRKWNRIQRIVKTQGVDPGLINAALAAVVLGIGIESYNKIRDKYREGFKDSAAAALERASKMQAKYTPRNNITFAVGGFSAEGSSGEKIKDILTSQANKEGATEEDKWFRDKHEFVVVDNPEFNIDPVGSTKKNPDGSYNPLYVAEVSSKAFGAYMTNVQRGRNEAAVDLAAQLFAYGNRRNERGTGREYSNKFKTFNVVAHATGGNTVYEAMEILSRMNAPRSRSGREILQQINVVTLGTTDFGVTQKGLARGERTITSSNDPFSFLPKRNERWISTVKGHEVEDYVNDSRVQEELRQALGFYDQTIYQRENKVRRRQVIVKSATKQKPKSEEAEQPKPEDNQPPSPGTRKTRNPKRGGKS